MENPNKDDSNLKISNLNDTINSEVDNESNKIKLSLSIMIFSLFLILNICINMNSGNIPPAIDNVKKDLNISDKEIGAFSSFVNIGIFIGGLISYSLINTLSMKYALILSNIGISLCLFVFTLDIFSNIVVLFLNRTFVGIFMSYIQVYFPLWVDKFVTKKAKAIMIALVQVAVPLGIVLGYLMTSLLLKYDFSVRYNIYYNLVER